MQTNVMMKKAGLLAIGAAAILLGACVSAAPKGAGVGAQKILPAQARQFVNINPAIRMAAAYGDRSVGMHGSFGKFPGQFETPFHTHTGAYHGIVIRGQMTNPFANGGSAKVMGPGSYWFVPANAAHQTACVSIEPCEFYFYADSAFDFTPVSK
ncbi:MAG: DUF4437 domain-containing protein [Gammaproteobacteria bacterium]|nr:DUF4437 domain-containing protein [Gammaproteobacteria bacterium]